MSKLRLGETDAPSGDMSVHYEMNHRILRAIRDYEELTGKRPDAIFLGRGLNAELTGSTAKLVKKFAGIKVYNVREKGILYVGMAAE